MHINYIFFAYDDRNAQKTILDFVNDASKILKTTMAPFHGK